MLRHRGRAAIPRGPRTCKAQCGMGARKPNQTVPHHRPRRSSRGWPPARREPYVGQTPSGRRARPLATGTDQSRRVVDRRMRSGPAHRARSQPGRRRTQGASARQAGLHCRGDASPPVSGRLDRRALTRRGAYLRMRAAPCLPRTARQNGLRIRRPRGVVRRGNSWAFSTLRPLLPSGLEYQSPRLRRSVTTSPRTSV